MMFMKKIFAIILSSVVICESAFVDTLIKCSINDEKCQINLMKKVLNETAASGLPEINMPPIDPVRLENVNVSFLNVLDLIFDGVIKGVKDCVFNEFKPNIEERVAMLNLTCDVVAIGRYKVHATGPFLQNLFAGKSFHGEGNGKAKVDGMNINMMMPYVMKKRGDDIFLHGKRNKLTYTFDVLGGLMFEADKLYLGEMESSATIVKLLNENWQLIVKSFGNDVIKIAINYVYNFIDKFFKNVATKHYFIEDLSSYVATKK